MIQLLSSVVLDKSLSFSYLILFLTKLIKNILFGTLGLSKKARTLHKG
jgi:hypothetical protein